MVLMFVVSPEKPKSILGVTFIFTTADSLFLPIMLIVGNEKILRHTINSYYETFVVYGLHIYLVPVVFFTTNIIIGNIM